MRLLPPGGTEADGIGDVRAKVIRAGLRRLREQILLNGNYKKGKKAAVPYKLV